MFMVLLLAAAAASPSLHLDPRLDAGLPCPAYSALRARLGALDPTALEARPGGEPLEVSLEWQEPGRSWKLRLNRTDGEAALERELNLGKTDCPLVAESAALVIDRYLVALREPAGHRQRIGAAPVKAPPRPAPTPAPKRASQPARPIAKELPAAPVKAPRDPEAAPVSAPSTPPLPSARPAAPPEAPARAVAEPAPDAVAPAPQRSRETVEPRPIAPPPDRGQLALAVGPAGIVGLPSDLRAALWLEAEHPITLASAPGVAGMPLTFTARLLFLASASSSERVFAGTDDRGGISARSILLGAAGGPCATRWLRFCASGVAGLRLISGGADGTGIFAQSSALLAQPELGAAISLDRQLSERLQLRFSLLLGVAPGSASLSIEGGATRRLSTVDLAAGLLLGYQLF